MIACANKNDPSWKKLEKKYGADRAAYFWDLYKGEIPEDLTSKPKELGALTNMIEYYIPILQGARVYISSFGTPVEYILNKWQDKKLLEWMNDNPIARQAFIITRTQVPNTSEDITKVTIIPKDRSIASNQLIKKVQRIPEKDLRVLDSLIAKLQSSLPGLQIEYINPEDLIQKEHVSNIDRINSFFRDGKVYLVHGRFNADTLVEEALHPFVSNLYVDNRKLFDNLLRTGKQENYALYENILTNWSESTTGYTPQDINKEFVTQLLQKHLSKEYRENPTHSNSKLRELVSQFIEWFRKLLQGKALFTNKINKEVLDIEHISPDISYQQLAMLFNIEDVQFDINMNVGGTFYNIDKANSTDTDKYFVAHSTEKKLTMIDNQLINLDNLLNNEVNRKNPVVIQTLERLVTMTTKARKFYSENVRREKAGEDLLPSIATSSAIGSSDFKDDNDYTMWNEFGSFIHLAIEHSQNLANDNNKSLSEVFTQEVFNDLISKFRENKTLETGKVEPLKIKNLNDEQLFNTIRFEVLSTLEQFNVSNNIVIPEFTVIGSALLNHEDEINKGETTIIGRIDLLVISPQGEIRIIDFKTKKVKGLVKFGGEFDFIEANRYLTTAIYPIDNTSFYEFQSVRRPQFDTWSAQLFAYENILRQNNIPLKDSQIVALLYEAIDTEKKDTDETNKFLGSKVYQYNNNFYDEAGTRINEQTGEIEGTYSQHGEDRKNKIRKVIDDHIILPVEKKQEREKQEEKYVFEMTELEYNNLVDKIKINLEKDITSVLNAIKKSQDKVDYDKDSLELLKYRLESLNRFKYIIDDPKVDVSYSLKFNFIMQRVADDIIELKEKWDKAYEVDTTIDGKRDTNKFNLKSHKLLQYYHLIENMSGLVNLINTQILKANSDGTLLKTSLINNAISDIKIDIDAMLAQYKEFTVDIIAEIILRTQSSDNFRKMNEELRLALEPKIKYWEKEITDIKDGMPIGWVKKLKYKVLSFLDKDSKDKADESLNPEQKDKVKHLEVLEKELLIMKKQYETGFVHDKKWMIDLINAVMDPNAKMYIGQDNPNLISMLRLRPDSFVAAASNGDVGISSFAIWLKNAIADATFEFQNDVALNRLQQSMDTFKEGRSTKEMNEIVSEVRNVQYMNKEGELANKDVLSMVSPSSTEYDNVFSLFESNTRRIHFKLKELENTLGILSREHNNIEYEKVKKEHSEYRLKYKELIQEHLKFKYENSSRQFVDEYYELLLELPYEVSSELELLYFEREKIQRRYGEHNEVEFTQDDKEHADILDIQIRKLKQNLRNKKDDSRRIALYDQLYEYVEQKEALARMDARKKIEYQNTPEKYDAWVKENYITVGNDDYWNTVGALYDRLGAIAEKKQLDGDGSMMRMQELLKQRSEIISRYRRNTKFDPTYLISTKYADTNPEFGLDREELNLINDEIEVLLKVEVSKKDPEVKSIFAQLAGLNEKELNEYYRKERKNRRHSLVKKLSLLNASKEEFKKTGSEQAREQVASDEAQFFVEENIFKNWYNECHKDEYKTILNSDIRILKFKVKPQFENTIPALLKHRETKGNQSWHQRKLHDGKGDSTKNAYNPNYQELPNGYPMPNGLTKINGIVQLDPNHEGYPKYVNSKFIELMGNNDAWNFYNTLMTMVFKMQEVTTGNNLGYLAPGVMSTKIENFFDKGLSQGLKDQYAKMIDGAFFTGISNEDTMLNIYGDVGLTAARFRHNRQLDLSVQTTDVINAQIKWLCEAYINKSLSDLQPLSEHYINGFRLIQNDLRKDTTDAGIKRVKEMDNLIDQLVFEKNKLVHGKTEDPSLRKVKKALNSVFNVGSFARLGFDVAAQLKNAVSGNLQQLLATDPLAHYTYEDYLWAKGQIFGLNGFFIKYVSDWGKVGDISKETAMFRLFNPVQKDYDHWLNLTTGDNKRRLIQKFTNLRDISYFLQEKGDMEIGITVWLAIMHKNKFNVINAETKEILKNPDGSDQQISAYDAYHLLNDGTLERKADIMFTKQDEERLRNEVYSEIRRAQGTYASSDMLEVEQNLIGKLGLFFRKYLIPQTLNRLGSIRPNWEGGEIAMGYWRAIGSIFKYYGPGQAANHLLLGAFSPKATAKFGGNQVNAYYSSKAVQASKDLYISLLLFSISMLLIGYVKRKRDDDEELSMFEGNAIRLLWGLRQETTSLLPVPGVGSFDDYARNFTTITSLVTDTQKVYRSVEHLLELMTVVPMYNYDMINDETPILGQFHQTSVYQRQVGIYEKETPKFYKDFMDLTGAKNIMDIFNPELRLQNAMKTQ